MKDLETMLQELSAYINPDNLNDALSIIRDETTERDGIITDLKTANEKIRQDYTKRFLGTGRTDNVSMPDGSLGKDMSDMVVTTADSIGGFDEVAEHEEDKPVTIDDILIKEEEG